MKLTTCLPPRGHPPILSVLPSIFGIMPQTDYAAFVHKRSAEQRMISSWERTNQQMKNAFIQVRKRHPLPPFEREIG